MKKVDELKDPTSCLNKAKDDELLFVLLGRDVAAPFAVAAWIDERIRMGKNLANDPQMLEAEQWIVGALLERKSVYVSKHDYRPATDEERELCEAAVRAVLATVRAARAAGKYQPYAWLAETEENQVHHAFEHCREIEKKYGGFTMFQPHEDHLAHLLTRGTILAAKLARKAADAQAPQA